ncbi:MAG: von Willebrand factor type A domain-containing protein [Treponema sp.]|nr:von Willebrand factor type A domain-containing protein [Treponema sp.]
MKKQFISKKTFNVVLSICTASFLLAGCSVNYGYAGDSFNGKAESGGYYDAALGDKDSPETTGDKFEEIKDNPFIKTADENVSTFSLDADTAAYSYMRNMLKNNRLPAADSVRIEEYLNYFTFDYDDPTDGATVSLNSEISACPWNNEHYLVRLGIKGKSVAKENIPLNNYVFLIDVSGSMDGSDRLELLKKGLIKMLDSMNPQDRVSIVTYSGKEELLLESTLVEDKELIITKIKKLVASGCTNGADAIKMAYNEALSHYIEGGNNRIIMGTDGDFNVGLTRDEDLLELVQSYATQEKSVYLTVCGFGWGNWNDSMMEKVSNKGNGTYVYVDSEEELNKVFVEETSRFISVANDCKAQITFNKDLVSAYRLIGYENRVLNNEDFENDDVDAAEIGAGQTVTALYEIIPAENCKYDAATKEFASPLFTFDFRYKENLNEESKLVKSEPKAFSETCSDNMRFAQAVAAYGMVLRKSEYKGSANLNMVLELYGNGFSFDPYGRRAQFAELVRKAKELIKES